MQGNLKLTSSSSPPTLNNNAKSSVAVVVSFFICWVPFHAQRLLASYLVKDENQNQLLLDIYLKLTYISGVMYYLSSTINPLLYQLMSAKFRLAFKETFKCSLFKCKIFRAPLLTSSAKQRQRTISRGTGISPTNSHQMPPCSHCNCTGNCSGPLQASQQRLPLDGSQLKLESASALAECSNCQLIVDC